jgi:hypothetical protein
MKNNKEITLETEKLKIQEIQDILQENKKLIEQLTGEAKEREQKMNAMLEDLASYYQGLNNQLITIQKEAGNIYPEDVTYNNHLKLRIMYNNYINNNNEDKKEESPNQ